MYNTTDSILNRCFSVLTCFIEDVQHCRVYNVQWLYTENNRQYFMHYGELKNALKYFVHMSWY